jgi:hypothetical protein
MNRQLIKHTILISNIALSLFCIILYIYDKKIEPIYSYSWEHIYHSIFFSSTSQIWGSLAYINTFYCFIGIFLFIRYLIYTFDKCFSKKYLLLIPSILISLLIIMRFIPFVFWGFPAFVFVLPIILLIAGSSLFLFCYLNYNYNIVIKIILCLLFPADFLLCFLSAAPLFFG